MKEAETELRRLRKGRGWSQKHLADLLNTSEDCISRWERGLRKPGPHYQVKLCELFQKDAVELGFVEPVQRHEDDSVPSTSRRQFMQGVLALPMEKKFVPIYLHHLSSHMLELRGTQKKGHIILEPLNNYLNQVQTLLNLTSDKGLRTELWRQLALLQLLLSLNPISFLGNSQAKTLHEQSIASARSSNDNALLAATIGHYAHFLVRTGNQSKQATDYLDQACKLLPKKHYLQGWFSLIRANIQSKCASQLSSDLVTTEALETASSLSWEFTDLYFTDYTATGTKAFLMNSLLNAKAVTQVTQFVTSLDLKALPQNRKASAYFDMARFYSHISEFALMEQSAIEALSMATYTSQHHIVKKCKQLAQQVATHHQCSEARAIDEYAQFIGGMR